MIELIKKNLNNKKTLVLTIIIWLVIISNFANVKVSLTIGDLLSLFGAFIGIIGAYGIATYQIRENDKRELKSKLPALVLGSISYKNASFVPGFDFCEEESTNPTESNITIPLINGGITNVYDITVNFNVFNYENYLEKYKEASNDIENEKRSFIIKSSLALPDNDNEIKFTTITPTGKSVNFLKNKSFIDGFPILFPQKSTEINIPFTYARLIQYHTTNIIPKIINEEYINEEDKPYFPLLESTINFKDYLGNHNKKVVYTISRVKKVKIENNVYFIDITIKHFDSLEKRVEY